MRIRCDLVSTRVQQAGGRVLLTGANGYVGGRLLRKLEESGRPVRCLVRRPEALSARATEQTEIVYGDVLDPDSLHEAFTGVTAAYYLWASQRALFGPLNPKFEKADLHDLKPFETLSLSVLAGLIVLFGILPFLFMDYIAPFAAALAGGFA